MMPCVTNVYQQTIDFSIDTFFSTHSCIKPFFPAVSESCAHVAMHLPWAVWQSLRLNHKF